MNNIRSSKARFSPWRQRLETKIKVTWREAGQLSEPQKGAMETEIPNKYNKLTIPEALAQGTREKLKPGK